MINARVAGPAKITSFNADLQRVDVQLMIQQIINGKNVSHAILVDLPLVFPTAGDYCITFPIAVGDEVLTIFADRCIDGWLKSGDISRQVTHRVHDISDGFALVGVNSEPNKIGSYSTDHLEIRNRTGDQVIRLHNGGNIEIEAEKVDITGDLDVSGDVTATGDIVAGGISLKSHTHIAPDGGGETTAPT
jgi:hypothetical protein